MGSTQALLRVDDISLSFGGIQALKNVSFEVHPGELFSIIGPNGAGKTSMLNCISGRYHPQIGGIHFREAEITNLKPNQRCHLGIGRTFQNLVCRCSTI